MIGQKFGRLTVLEECKERKHGGKQYKCLCDCGNYVNVRKDMLKSGNTKSCGCLQRETASDMAKKKIKHGKCNTRLYKIYYKIINRCYNKNMNRYSDWGGRGIVVCDEWLNDFMNFYNWAINNGYQDNLSIDRVNNDGNYEPSNCRWITNKEQSNNRRSNITITYNGKTQTLKQWAENLKVSYSTLYMRYKNNWDIKNVLFGKDVTSNA